MKKDKRAWWDSLKAKIGSTLLPANPRQRTTLAEKARTARMTFKDFPKGEEVLAYMRAGWELRENYVTVSYLTLNGEQIKVHGGTLNSLKHRNLIRWNGKSTGEKYTVLVLAK